MPLTLTWSANCVLASKAKRNAVPVQEGNPAVAAVNNPTAATFKITDSKLYIPVVFLSTQDDNKLLEKLKTGFKRNTKWNKHRLEMSNQIKSQ